MRKCWAAVKPSLSDNSFAVVASDDINHFPGSTWYAVSGKREDTAASTAVVEVLKATTKNRLDSASTTTTSSSTICAALKILADSHGISQVSHLVRSFGFTGWLYGGACREFGRGCRMRNGASAAASGCPGCSRTLTLVRTLSRLPHSEALRPDATARS